MKKKVLLVMLCGILAMTACGNTKETEVEETAIEEVEVEKGEESTPEPTPEVIFNYDTLPLTDKAVSKLG